MFVLVAPRTSSSSSPPPVRLTRGAPVSSVGSFTQVASLQPSKETGPEEESLRYSETWDELKKRKFPSKEAKTRKDDKPIGELGELVVASEVLSLIISWRAQHGTTASPTLSARKAASSYRNAAKDTGHEANKSPSSATESTLF